MRPLFPVGGPTPLIASSVTAPVSIQHGSAVSVAVTVTGTGGTPTGNVALVATGSPATQPVEGTVASPSVLTLTNGTATNSSYTDLPGGSYNLSANYAGDGTFGPSVSNPPIAVTVSPEPSTLVLFIQDFSATTSQAGTPTSVPYGTYVSVAAQPSSTAQLNQNPTYFTQATGTVTFKSTPALAALDQTTSLNSNGFAEIPGQLTLAYPPGTYSVSASYSGDASLSASSAAAQTFTIIKNNVSIAAANGTTSGTVLVEVDPAAGDLQLNSGLTLPTGVVTLTNSSGAVVGTGTLAVVTNPTTQTTAAQTTITVTGSATTINYPGDTNYNSGTAAFTPSGGGGTFTLSAAPAAITVPSGGSKTTQINITPQSGFAGTVTVTCSVSGGPTCSLAKPSVAVSGTAAVADTLTVGAGSASGALHIPANPSRGTWYAAGGAAFAGILLIGLPGRRRAWQRMLSLMLLVIAVGVVGCGGSSSSGGGGNSTFTVTVTATSGSLTQTTTVTATVQ